MLTADLASLRASWRQELVRLAARPLAGGPMDAIRSGSLLAFFDWQDEAVEVTAELLDRLRALPNGAGVEAVRSTMSAVHHPADSRAGAGACPAFSPTRRPGFPPELSGEGGAWASSSTGDQ